MKLTPGNATTSLAELRLDFETLRAAYREGTVTPVAVIREVYRRIREARDDTAWISLVPESEAVAVAQGLEGGDVEKLPLYGLPFAIKDNIHVRGMETTAGCQAFGSYPEQTATVVIKLLDAGAVLVGKNTMDEFATGLVGIRSAKHPVNVFDPEYIPGGSSSGSAVAVASGMVSFALGSDTGGSGRIPAALNNIVGLKPTPGIISKAGMVYANRSIDCASVFALHCQDAKAVFDVALGADPTDPFMRPNPDHQSRGVLPVSDFVIGVPDRQNLTFFGDRLSEAAFGNAIETIVKLGGTVREIDFSPFAEVGSMLFQGPIVAERMASVGKFIEEHPTVVHPAVAAAIESATQYSAVDLVNEYYRLRELSAVAHAQLRKVDVLMVPTTATIYKIETVEADPITCNSRMGYYSYFANLLGLSALAVPASFRPDGLPFGVCFLAGPQADSALMDLGTRFEKLTALRSGVPARDGTALANSYDLSPVG
ncbi:MAG: allophanate hydrolase [Gammaproteobacteria bacterium]